MGQLPDGSLVLIPLLATGMGGALGLSAILVHIPAHSPCVVLLTVHTSAVRRLLLQGHSYADPVSERPFWP